jgi:CRISPR-associated protein Csb2
MTTTRYLCIGVKLLDPLFHGQGDDDEPEWPPSPMRFFQALVAGSRTGWLNGRWSASTDNDALRLAFEWLEKREPPEIIAPQARKAAAYTFYVPNNDGDAPRKFDRQDRLTSKVARPYRIVGGTLEAGDHGTLNFVWPIGEGEWPTAEIHVKVLCREARNLMALGWAIDQAVGHGQVLDAAQLDALPGVRWRAWRGHFPGRQRLRIPKEGSLKDLEAVHESFVNRIRISRRKQTAILEYVPVRKLRCFDTVVYQRTRQLPPRHYAAFELPDGVAFRQEIAIEVAAMLRSLTCNDTPHRNRYDFSEQFPDVDPEVYLAGHTKDNRSAGADVTPPRFSYMPLPTIGHKHADGLIRRLLIAEPFGGNGSCTSWAQQRLHGKRLRDKEGDERGVLMQLWRKTSTAMIERYVAESRTWATVTPVILPGFDDAKKLKGIPADERHKSTKAERLFCKALAHAGVPLQALSDITLRKAPFWPGSQHPNLYRRPDYLDSAKNRRFSAWHAHLVFREPVGGPLAIGAGRHAGLGLFAAWPHGPNV